MGRSDLPDTYIHTSMRAPKGKCGHIRQIMTAHYVTLWQHHNTMVTTLLNKPTIHHHYHLLRYWSEPEQTPH